MATLIPGFNKIYSLNDYKIKEVPILNKYMPFKYLKENIENNKIVFVSPKTWQDPFEQIYYMAENFEKYNYKKPNIFCMCLTENSTRNEAAAWKMYQNETDKIIQVRFWAENMLKQLDEFCQSQNFSIYIGKINYSFFQAQIKNLYKKSNPLHTTYFPDNFSNENFLNLLLLKRSAFEFEQEVRIFLMPDDEKPDLYSKNLFYVSPFDYNNATIYSLKIAPMLPYDESQKKEELDYKNKLKKLLPTLDSKKFQQSHLYEPEKIINLFED